jgi:hypothetical protein
VGGLRADYPGFSPHDLLLMLDDFLVAQRNFGL